MRLISSVVMPGADEIANMEESLRRTAACAAQRVYSFADLISTELISERLPEWSFYPTAVNMGLLPGNLAERVRLANRREDFRVVGGKMKSDHRVFRPSKSEEKGDERVTHEPGIEPFDDPERGRIGAYEDLDRLLAEPAERERHWQRPNSRGRPVCRPKRRP